MEPKDAWREVLCGQVELALEIGCRIVRVEAVGLGRLKSKQRVSNGEKKVGWAYRINEVAWSEAREDLERRGK
ncbi:Acetyltransferase [Colletotrichum higginsianum IMI 349063]|uniref:Acetyltransferase n=1 Tax=Colletotrichum higginsianum (strain IMI 349063) TaxID=759273 RepID=A0A1B7YUX8_COLHI|nr:Acetyltransferase [Colletotrichum higginsianum IMI 349063]OBR15688.1 Acetyltransferase [Colletotrichum higginsianum IMI 349063]